MCPMLWPNSYDLRFPNTCVQNAVPLHGLFLLPRMSFCSPFQPSELLLVPQSAAHMALPFADEETRPERGS